MPSPVRGARLRQGKSRVPQVPHQEAGAAALGVRGFRQERFEFAKACGSLRIVRRSSRTRRLLARRYELVWKVEEIRKEETGEGGRRLNSAPILRQFEYGLNHVCWQEQLRPRPHPRTDFHFTRTGNAQTLQFPSPLSLVVAPATGRLSRGRLAP